jgi:hypothetical protein
MSWFLHIFEFNGIILTIEYKISFQQKFEESFFCLNMKFPILIGGISRKRFPWGMEIFEFSLIKD